MISCSLDRRVATGTNKAYNVILYFSARFLLINSDLNNHFNAGIFMIEDIAKDMNDMSSDIHILAINSALEAGACHPCH